MGDAMAHEFYVTIKGQKQGQFTEVSSAGRDNTKIVGRKFSYEVTSPHDSATGQATGRRQHKPVTITKEWSATSPKLFQALITSEILESVLFEFTRTAADGTEEIYYTIKLKNASVSNLKQYLDENLGTEPEANKRELEDVTFVFQFIEVEHLSIKTTARDDLSQGVTP
jgi:type VI secretion system secreted protein Hcp